MKNAMLSVVVSAISLLSSALGASAPEFGQFPAEATLVGQPAALVLDSKKAKLFRTVLREAAALGPNFNGHYRVAFWGCGTNCIDWAVIDLSNGRVWFAPERVSSCWPDKPPKTKVPDWFESIASSRLLYSYECVELTHEVTFNARHVYEWKNGRANLLRTDTVAF